MPPRIRLLYSTLTVTLFLVAAVPLYTELTQRSDIWWTPRGMLVPLAESADRVEVYARGRPLAALLEAGKKLPIEQELRSMQWPYDHPRRGDAPPGSHHLSFNEYTIRKPPYAKGAAFKHVYSYVGGWGGSDYVKNILVDEKEHPYTGSNYAWVRARCLGGKTNIWGRLALRLSDYDFKAKTHDGYGEDWPIAYADLEPYYDKVDLYLGISGVKENLPHLPDSLFQRPNKLTLGEVKLRESLKKMGRVVTPYRAGVTTDGVKHNRYRSKCYGRGACDRRPGGCDIHAAFDSPTGLIYPAMD